MRKLTGTIVVAAAMSAAGCLQKETTHTIYLSPDGRATWTVVEQNVRSDENDAGGRAAEEQAYLLAAEGSDHGVGRGLAALSPARLRTRIIRGDRPFHVVTDAEFSTLEFAVQRFVTGLGLPADVLVTYDGPVTTLRVRIDRAQAMENDTQKPKEEAENPLVALAEELDAYRFTLTAGRFVSAVGFTLADDDTTAVPVKPAWDEVIANGGVLELSLGWRR